MAKIQSRAIIYIEAEEVMASKWKHEKKKGVASAGKSALKTRSIWTKLYEPHHTRGRAQAIEQYDRDKKKDYEYYVEPSPLNTSWKQILKEVYRARLFHYPDRRPPARPQLTLLEGVKGEPEHMCDKSPSQFRDDKFTIIWDFNTIMGDSLVENNFFRE
ncbi:hypothetical protein CR513_16440, partial [Mucuna pruriens]